MRKFIFGLLAAFSFMSFVSCRSEITLTAQKDGSLIVEFNGECGPYFEKMVREFTGSKSSILFNPAELKQDFVASGFTNITCTAPSTVGLYVKMTETGKSFLSKSEMVVSDKNNVILSLSPDILKSFYNSADSTIVTVLDLLISPVFNDEIMSEEEYLEMLGSFYGNEASEEVGNCNILLTLISSNGQKKEASLPLAKLLCLNEKLVF
ncbi:MAG: hypothetical protein HUK25_06830 [Treponema sp.]|nr:hypothetical protein [Treponema sp.]